MRLGIKIHKKELLATGQACTKMQHATAHLLKSNEFRTRIESSNSSGSKHEKQLRKSADDIKRHVEIYNQALEVFEPAMMASTEVLEELEKNHVEQLCDYMTKLHKGYASCIAISQINNAAFQETLENNAKPEYILGQFAKRRGTGMERPRMESFDPGEAGAGNISISPEKQRTDDLKEWIWTKTYDERDSTIHYFVIMKSDQEKFETYFRNKKTITNGSN